ncbi:MAG: cell division protein FtsZ [bacterium]
MLMAKAKPKRIINAKTSKKKKTAGLIRAGKITKKRMKPIEIKELNIEKTVTEELGGVHQTKIRLIGIGGGGNSIVSEIASRISKASFILADTDIRNLRKPSKGVRAFSFGQSVTRGMGTGMNSELGRLAAQGEKEKISKIAEGQDLCILVSCLGGGVGSGAAPIFAKASQELGNITYGIFTLPFKFEGERKMEIAREALAKVKPYLNALTVIPNEALFEVIDKSTPLNAALSSINNNLSESLEGLIETIYDPGLINIDFADLRTVFEGKGRFAYLNTVRASGPAKNEEALKKLLFNPLYPYTVKGSKGIIFNIAGKDLTLDGVADISKAIFLSVNHDAKIIFGLSSKGKNEGEIKITILATGCGVKTVFPLKPKELSEIKIKKEKQRPVRLKKKSSPKKKIVIPTSPEVKKEEIQPVKTKISLVKKKTKNKRKIILKKKKVLQVVPKKEKPKPKEKIKEEKKVKESIDLPIVSSASEPTVKLASSMTMEAQPKIRRNGIQVKKANEQIEQEILNNERDWEMPAFLRKKLSRDS